MSEKHHTTAHAATGKDVIYIDVDDEITAIIDKLQASPQKIVALVLPKRASAFQSVVNMKLLKRSAEHAKKNVVLITSDPNVTPLAGGVGLHVAKSLQSKPEVPDTPEMDDKTESVEETDEPVDKSKSLAELNGDDEETIELDDEDETPGSSDGKDKKSGKNPFKKFSIPNFNKFRIWLFAGGGALIALIVFGVLAFTVLPKAKVVVSTDSQAIEISQDIKLKTGDGVTVDPAQGIVPAHKQEVKKTISEEVPATGQQNNGEKATGHVTLSLGDCAKDQVTVPAGTGLSANGKTFITKSNVTLESVEVGNQCKNSQFPQFSTKKVAVTAQTGGAANNIGPSNFTVAGYSNITGASDEAMAGGTDNITKIVVQADIDSAKQKIGSQDTEAARAELEQALKDAGYLPIASSFVTATPTTQQSANVGQAAESVKVTQEVVYSMLGIKPEDLEKLIAEQVKTKIDTSKQSVVDYGLNDAVFTQLGLAQADGATVGFQATVITGTDLKEDELKQQVAGKKANQAEELIKAYPGVTAVDVTYSPFWVSSIPKKTSKITIVIEEPQASSDSSDTSQ